MSLLVNTEIYSMHASFPWYIYELGSYKKLKGQIMYNIVVKYHDWFNSWHTRQLKPLHLYMIYMYLI